MAPILAGSRSATDVLIVGAGPTGLTLATALTARGVRPIVIDRLAEGANTSRAAVVHARTLEALESLGVSERLARLGVHARRFTIRDRDRVLVPIDFDALPTRYPYTLMVSQATTESVLLQRFVELGGQVLRPLALADLAQDPRGVSATLDDGSTVRARYVVGADGMHSIVRDRSGIAFLGGSYEESFMLADVRLAGGAPSDEVILYFSSEGMVVVAPLPDGVHRIVAAVEEAPEQPSAAYVQALLDARGPLHDRAIVQGVIWGSRFRLHHRVAKVYRAGRAILAGDAAHVHSPAGGQGMNAGILDAIMLADALVAALTQGQDAALDGYGARRRPIAEHIVSLADRLTRLATVRPVLRPVRNLLLTGFAHVPSFRRCLAWQLSGLAYR
jgi:2-polyprenyl-6-methoxyphenol hydroxylase-like FAD-dependent oxidoreductase